MNKDVFQKAKSVFNNIPFVKTVGDIELIKVEDFVAVAKFVVTERISNYIGGLHGGAVAGVVDSVVFFPGKLLPSGERFTTSGFDIKFFRPSSIGDVLLVKAEIIHFGKRRVNVEAEVFLQKSNKLIAKANVDLMRI